MQVIPEPAVVDLHLVSEPESVALVRAGLKGVGSWLALAPELLEDMQMATSEACNNVVLHAYRHGPGPLDVRITAWHDGVDVVVRDHGRGLTEQPDDDARTGLGLLVIESLADRTECAPVEGGGTEVCIHIDHPVDAIVPVTGGAVEPEPIDGVLALPGDVVASIYPLELLEEVLARLTRALAAHAHFSVDRLSDLHTFVGSVAAHAGRHARTRCLTCSLGADRRRLQLLLAPIRADADGTIPQPTGALEVEPRLDAETLHLTLRERGFASAA
jgi:serine/threonine-protein kinase RsbW